MPSPAAAAIPAATVFAYPYGLYDYRAALPALAMVLVPAALMVSTIRFRSFKTIDLQSRRSYTVILLIAAGIVLTVVFTLAGQRFCGLNGGPQFPHSEAVSFMIETEDQAETDRLWDAIASNGGQPGPCGWIKDRWGVSWQITPKRLLELFTDQDRGRAQRAMQAMMQMSKIDIAALERAARGRPG